MTKNLSEKISLLNEFIGDRQEYKKYLDEQEISKLFLICNTIDSDLQMIQSNFPDNLKNLKVTLKDFMQMDKKSFDAFNKFYITRKRLLQAFGNLADKIDAIKGTKGKGWERYKEEIDRLNQDFPNKDKR